jgi:methionine biosynthesis protein MetW
MSTLRPDSSNGSGLRPDLAAIADMIRHGSRVLDVGCGDGALLEHLVRTKDVDGRGIELSQANVNACVARGLAVVQGDADTDLVDYPAQAFDAVILSQTIQATEKPRAVLNHLLRIGRRTAVSLPNFGYWKVRLSLLTGGRMPRTSALDYSWSETPNIHLCTLADFVDLTAQSGASIVEAHALNDKGGAARMNPDKLTSGYLGPNLFAQGAIFLLKKN